VRILAAAFAAIVAALAVELSTSARADQPSPFPSPSPGATVAPGEAGYFAFDLASMSASGGMIPASVTVPSPRPFRAAGATGYSLELQGRLSPSYVGTIDFADTNIHGDDNAYVSRFEGSVVYEFSRSSAAVGIGYAALQRSTIPTSADGFGFGVALLPDFSRRISPYGSAFFYPSLPAPKGPHGALDVFRLGIAYTPPGQSGWFARIGYLSQSFSAITSSPNSLSGADLGIGVRF